MPPIEWPNETTFRLPVAAVGGDIVAIERVTPVEQMLVKFQDGNVLTADDLNKAVLQILYRQQEVADAYNRSIGRAFVRLATRGSVPIESEAVLDDIAQAVVTNEVLDSFRARLADIDLNGQRILEQATAVDGFAADILRLEGDIATQVTNEANARIDGDQAMVDTVALIGARSGDGLAFIADLNTLRVSPTESFAERLSGLAATDADNAAAILSEQSARVAGDEAEATARTQLAATLRDETAALITDEATARANADSAEASARQALETTIRGEITAAVQSEQTARVDGDNALASTLNLLGAQNQTGTAFILDEDRVLMNSGGSLAVRLSGLDSAIADNNATIVQEQLTRAQADGALAQDISALSTTVDGNTATISTIQTSLNGVRARYGVQLDVNGYITGFVQNNDGQSGSFDVLADKFRVSVPGVTPRQVFSVDANGVTMTGDVRIDGALIVNETVQTDAIPQYGVSNSSYFQTAYAGSLSPYPTSVWTDFNVATSGGTGGETPPSPEPDPPTQPGVNPP